MSPSSEPRRFTFPGKAHEAKTEAEYLGNSSGGHQHFEAKPTPPIISPDTRKYAVDTILNNWNGQTVAGVIEEADVLAYWIATGKVKGKDD